MTSTRYLLLVLILLAGLSAAAIAFNVGVDPYALEAAKTGKLDTGERRSGAAYRKAVHARHANARTVILGTSRAATGVPNDHAAFTEQQRPVINLALGAAGIEQTRLFLIHAHSTSPLRAAIVGLDLEAFLDDDRTDIDAGLLAGNPESQPALIAWLRTNVSLATLGASVRQHFGIELGNLADSSDATAGRDDTENEGQRIDIWTTEFWNFHGRLPALFPGSGTRSNWSNDAARQAAMTAFRELLRYARREGIELRLFISPVHARYLDWYRRVGWWPLYEAWKRGLVTEIEREAHEHPEGKPFVLWDMSGFRGPAAEAVPRLNDATSRMQWYLETSHYNTKLGARILDIVMGNAALDEDWPVVRIDTRNVNAHLLRLYADADAWREANPGETGNVAAMVAYLRRQARR